MIVKPWLNYIDKFDTKELSVKMYIFLELKDGTLKGIMVLGQMNSFL